jgi:hypothetical protein
MIYELFIDLRSITKKFPNFKVPNDKKTFFRDLAASSTKGFPKLQQSLQMDIAIDKVTLRPTVSQSDRLGVEPRLCS